AYAKVSKSAIVSKLTLLVSDESASLGCRCIKTTSQRVALRTVAKVEVTPPSGRCRHRQYLKKLINKTQTYSLIIVAISKYK
uniref:Chemokine interleukin-8-like domain-containing protein n=1 Tax=Poecilia reticulata TaxID=8081 RepID=A0A3P9N6L8_POERE